MNQLEFKALLVGNGIFDVAPQSLVALKGPRNDVRVLKDTLSHPQVGLFGDDAVKVLLDSTQKETVAEIENFFSGAKVNDQLFFYYSGHGILDIKNNLYLCARDTDPDHPVSTGISDSQINNIIQSSASNRIIIVLDCCHSGRFKNAATIPATLAGEGRFVIASTRAGELAADSTDESELSAFTNYFCKALLSGEVDTNKDGYVSLGEIYSFIYPLLRNKTKQIPQMKFDDAVGEIIIGRTVTESSPARAEPAPRPSAQARLMVSAKSIVIDDAGPDESLPEEIIDVYDENGGAVDWTYECNDAWIATERYRNSLKLRFSPKRGTNRGRVYIRDVKTGATERIEIKVTVVERAQPPRLELSEESIDFGTVMLNDKQPTSTIRIFNSGGGNLTPTVSTTSDIVRVTISGDMATVALDNSRPGPFTGEIRFSSEGGNKVVRFTGTIVKGPILGISPERIVFRERGKIRGEPLLLKIFNSGDGALEWSVTPSDDWLKVEKTKEGLVIRVTGTPGTYEGSLFVKSNGGTKTVPVSGKIHPIEQPKVQPVRSPITGKWLSQPGCFTLISGAPPIYQIQDYNAMGICTGNGTITQADDGTFILQVFNIIIGQVRGRLSIDATGNFLSGTIESIFGANQAVFQKSM
jgi:hypothetical protein